MDNIITYDAVQIQLAKTPSLNPCPSNFFNIRALGIHFTNAPKKISCPQSAGNGWAGAAMLPKMYILINPSPFNLNIAPVTTTPAYPNKFNHGGDLLPYMREEKSIIDVKFARVKTTLRLEKTYTEHAMTRSTRP